MVYSRILNGVESVTNKAKNSNKHTVKTNKTILKTLLVLLFNILNDNA